MCYVELWTLSLFHCQMYRYSVFLPQDVVPAMNHDFGFLCLEKCDGVCSFFFCGSVYLTFIPVDFPAVEAQQENLEMETVLLWHQGCLQTYIQFRVTVNSSLATVK